MIHTWYLVHRFLIIIVSLFAFLFLIVRCIFSPVQHTFPKYHMSQLPLDSLHKGSILVIVMLTFVPD